jgi:imidazolonepropionase-like amidohydrolase
VKLIASGGGLTPGTRPAEADLSEEIIRAATEAAHANGVYVTAHCHATESMVRCLDAGVDMIEHATFLTAAGVPVFDASVARRMRDQGTILSPTVISGARIAEQILRTGLRNRDDAGAVRRLRARREHLSHFFECGVRVVAGTDCGVPNTPFDSLADELAAYVEAGMTAVDALRSATSGAARFLCSESLGRISAGSPADILLLTANPLENIETLRQPAVVIKAGEIACDFRTVGAR